MLEELDIPEETHTPVIHFRSTLKSYSDVTRGKKQNSISSHADLPPLVNNFQLRAEN